MTDSEETSIKPFFKADSGSFTNTLKMPLSSFPGRRPGDFCLDDLVGSVKVRRQDQSILILGGVGGTPSWAQTVAINPSSGAPIIVNGNLTFPTPSSIITSSGDLTLAPSSGIINITGDTLTFSGTGTIRSGGAGDILLIPASGVVNVDSGFLLFSSTASIASLGVLTVSSTGALNLQAVSSQVNIVGNDLSFSKPTTIEALGTLTLAPSSVTIAFPNDITMLPSSGNDFIISNSGDNTGVILQRGDALFGQLLLSNHHLVFSSLPPTINYTEASPQYTVTLSTNSTDMAGGFSISSTADIGFAFQLVYSRPYTGSTTFVVFSPTNQNAGQFNHNWTIRVNGTSTFCEFFGTILNVAGGTISYSYIVVGAI